MMSASLVVIISICVEEIKQKFLTEVVSAFSSPDFKEFAFRGACSAGQLQSLLKYEYEDSRFAIRVALRLLSNSTCLASGAERMSLRTLGVRFCSVFLPYIKAYC